MNKEIKDIKILIIEDDKDIIYIITQVLNHLGFKVYQSSDGFDGLDRIKKIHPDLILLDIMMPNLNGYGFMKKVKDLKIYDTVPIISMSALDTAESVTKARELGAVEYIKKPIEIDVLKEKIIKVMKLEKYISTESETIHTRNMSIYMRKEREIVIIKLTGYVNKIDLIDLKVLLKDLIVDDIEYNKLVIDLVDISNDSLDDIVIEYLFRFYNIDKFYAKNVKIVVENEKIKYNIKSNLIACRFESVKEYPQAILKIRIGA